MFHRLFALKKLRRLLPDFFPELLAATGASREKRGWGRYPMLCCKKSGKKLPRHLSIAKRRERKTFATLLSSCSKK